jgi:hypothetical protein
LNNNIKQLGDERSFYVKLHVVERLYILGEYDEKDFRMKDMFHLLLDDC